MMIDFDAAVKRLAAAEDVLILTHASPDGDTLGGGFALLRVLHQLGKKARLINNDRIPDKYSYLCPEIRQPNFREKFIVSVDVADKALLGARVGGIYGGRVDLSIDHHENCRPFAKETYVEGGSASVCEVVYLLAKALGARIDSGIADCIYTGCSTDTGCFRYSNVTKRTHEIAAELIEYGAAHAQINVKMFETKSLAFIRLQTLALEQLEMHFDKKVSVLAVTREMLEKSGAEEHEEDAIVALARQIEGVRVGVTFKEKENGVFKASVRTHEGIDAAKICAAFSGGGHARAAGCSFECTLAEAKRLMLAEIEKHI